MLKIGVTGNIGSGKSQVCRIFQILGIPVYDADSKAKELMVNDKGLTSSIKALIGEQAYLSDGSLNRGLISERVFNDKMLLDKLNALVHPAVGIDFISWAASHPASYVIKEAALLFESGSYKELDGVIMVTAPEKLRIRRVMSRDGMTEEQVVSRIRNQMGESEKTAMSDYLVSNDGDAFLVRQVLELHRSLLEKAQKANK